LASHPDKSGYGREDNVTEIKIFNPDGIYRPKSPYMQVTRARGSEFAFIAGQVPVDTTGKVVGEGDFEAQCAQVFRNIATALGSVGADWSNVVQFTSYVIRVEDLSAFTSWRAREFPSMFKNREFPPNTLLVINRLAEAAFLLEVQTIAVL
jgi:enamine deaminase RidA (YjgF/YER057c/UK114 family)